MVIDKIKEEGGTKIDKDPILVLLCHSFHNNPSMYENSP